MLKLEGSPVLLSHLVQAARDSAPVSGLTHNFYRYPARFSPQLVRAAIAAFTEPGDLVVDPFVGGGTTLVEALAAGRNSIGSDISSLATFVSEVKTRTYGDGELEAVANWAKGLDAAIKITAPTTQSMEEGGERYQQHLSSRKTWRLRKGIQQAIDSARELESKDCEKLARCVILRTAQWALNGRKELPSVPEFKSMILNDVELMLQGARDLRAAVAKTGPEMSVAYCLNRTTHGLETEHIFREHKPPKLVITSPPYPGIHVLYHRWQVDGRKETAAPFWIADRRDGDGEAYYTMGSRSAKALSTYFASLERSLRSVAAICDEETVIVQVVAFSQPVWQLPRYLSVADDAGLEERFLPDAFDSHDGRLWRSVPNRRWYAGLKGPTGGSTEVVLFHKLRKSSARIFPAHDISTER